MLHLSAVLDYAEVLPLNLALGPFKVDVPMQG